jgi:uncharacterized membrane protein YidH (DUF202 family)
MGQRSSLVGSSGGLGTLSAGVPSFNRLIDGIQRKKLRESLAIALLVALLICLTIWWLFLR